MSAMEVNHNNANNESNVEISKTTNKVALDAETGHQSPADAISLKEDNSNLKTTPKRTPSKRLSYIERARKESEELVRNMGGVLELEGGRRTRSSARGTPPAKMQRVSPVPTPTRGRGRARKLETTITPEKNKANNDEKVETEDNVDAVMVETAVEEAKKPSVTESEQIDNDINCLAGKIENEDKAEVSESEKREDNIKETQLTEVENMETESSVATTQPDKTDNHASHEISAKTSEESNTKVKDDAATKLELEKSVKVSADAAKVVDVVTTTSVEDEPMETAATIVPAVESVTPNAETIKQTSTSNEKETVPNHNNGLIKECAETQVLGISDESTNNNNDTADKGNPTAEKTTPAAVNDSSPVKIQNELCEPKILNAIDAGAIADGGDAAAVQRT